MSERGPRTHAWTAPKPISLWLLPLAITFLGYGFTLGDSFLSDDFVMLHRAATAPNLAAAATLNEQWSEVWFRPLTFWTWYWQHPLFGENPFGYRLTNLLLHSLNSALLGWLVIALLGRRTAGIAAACVFAAFPIHAEAVTWVAARADVLCALGLLVALLAWTRFLSDGWRARHLVLVAFALLFACAAKETGMTAPAFLGIVLVAFRRPFPRRAWVGIAVVGVVTLGWLAGRYAYIGDMGGIKDAQGNPIFARFDPARIAEFVGDAAAICFLPVHLKTYPSFWHPLRLVPALALLAGLVFHVRRGGLGGTLRELWPLLLAFVLSLSQIATWSSVHVDNQQTRFLYIPTLFTCAAIGAVLGFAWSGRGRVITLALLVPAVGTWLTGLVLENRNWHEASKLAEQIVDAFPAPTRGNVPIYVTDLPDNHRGAFVFRTAFPFAVRLRYDDKLRVFAMKRKMVVALKQRGTRGAFLRWDRRRADFVLLATPPLGRDGGPGPDGR